MDSSSELTSSIDAPSLASSSFLLLGVRLVEVGVGVDALGEPRDEVEDEVDSGEVSDDAVGENKVNGGGGGGGTCGGDPDGVDGVLCAPVAWVGVPLVNKDNECDDACDGVVTTTIAVGVAGVAGIVVLATVATAAAGPGGGRRGPRDV